LSLLFVVRPTGRFCLCFVVLDEDAEVGAAEDGVDVALFDIGMLL